MREYLGFSEFILKKVIVLQSHPGLRKNDQKKITRIIRKIDD